MTIAVPQPPFAVRTRISPTFVPAEVTPGSVDTRHLGAIVTYRTCARAIAAARGACARTGTSPASARASAA